MLTACPDAAHGQSYGGAGFHVGYDIDYERPVVGFTARLYTDAFVFTANLGYLHQASRDAEDPQARIVQLDVGGLLPVARRGALSVQIGGGPALQYVHVDARTDSSGTVAVEGRSDVRLGFNGIGEARLHLFGPLRAFMRAAITFGTPTRTRFTGGLLVIAPLQ